MPKTFLIRKKQGLKDSILGENVRADAACVGQNKVEQLTGTTINDRHIGCHWSFGINGTNLRSPLPADCAEKIPRSSDVRLTYGSWPTEHLSHYGTRSAFEHWPVVKQRLQQLPIHGAFPQRSSILPSGFNKFHDEYSSYDFEINAAYKRMQMSPPFSPTLSFHACALPMNKASEYPFPTNKNHLDTKSIKFDETLWRNSIEAYHNLAMLSYTKEQCVEKRRLPFFHPYKKTTDTSADDIFRQVKSPDFNVVTAKVHSPNLPKGGVSPGSPPFTPTRPTSSESKVELINGGYGIKNPLLSAECRTENETNISDKIHSESKFGCKICGKLFDFPKLLQRHLKCHREVKRYLCTFCGKGFNDTFDLKRHTRTHTGVRPYKCEMCDKAFTQRCSLESHCRKIHGVEFRYGYKERRGKVYVCEDCGHVTSDPEDHFVHIKDSHPFNPTILRCFDKRHFKFDSERAISMKTTS
ncbi:nucleic acid binding [Mactra antiquata]